MEDHASAEIKQNLEELRKQVDEILIGCGRRAGLVKIIAVSKTQPVKKILDAIEAGQTDFGENRVQELEEKFPFAKEMNWHLIGHLQTNKVKFIAKYIHLIHSVDSEKLLSEINQQAEKNNRVIPVLLQLNISNEDQKSGMDEQDCEELLKCVPSFNHIKVLGLMGIAALTEDESLIRSQFRKLKNSMEKFKKYEGNNIVMQELSMGMSGDYPIAIEEGATMIRVGSLIFGSRNY